jgi:hypothetical protein
MNVIMLAPGYPGEMPYFCRGLAAHGALVHGLSDVPEHQLPQLTRENLSGYLRVTNFGDEDAVVREVRQAVGENRVDRVVCLWEPGVILAAKLREALGVPGMRVSQANTFRNKDLMKQKVAAAGLRTPKHASSTTFKGVRDAAQEIGFPVIVKPIAGAGSMDTIRADSLAELDEKMKAVAGYDEVNVEEFIVAEEYTFDTICVDGEIKYFNIGYYRPPPLIARTVEWISPQTLCLRDVDAPNLGDGIELGRNVLKAMEFQTGFTHMEWLRTNKGEVVFGEIACRPPGAHTVDLMNYVADIDLFHGYAEAELHGRFSTDVQRKYTSANIFKRAQGRGRITRITGLESLLNRFGEHIVNVDLLPVGAMRRDWILTLISDGFVTVRHPDFQACMEIADAVGTDLQMYAE